MDVRRKQFIRMMDMVIDLLKQAKNAGALAPQRDLADALGEMVERAKELRDLDTPWFFGIDAGGNRRSASGQIIGDNNEG